MKNGRLFVVLGIGLGLLLAPCNGQTLGGGGGGRPRRHLDSAELGGFLFRHRLQGTVPS